MNVDEPRWPRGAPEDEHHHGQGGRWVARLAAGLPGGLSPLLRVTGGNPAAYHSEQATELRTRLHTQQAEHLERFTHRHYPAGTPEAEVHQDLARRAKEAFAGRKVEVRVPPEALEAILASGRFQTQHETGASGGGYYDPSWRAGVEEALFGTPRDAPERPVYGYLRIDAPGQGGVARYGSVRVVLKDQVRSRTTAMFGDSADEADMGRGSPAPVDEPDWRAFGPSGPATRVFGPLDRDLARISQTHYLEAQVHGGVSVDDIAEVVLREQPSPSLLRLLEQRGVPWRVG